MSSDVAVAAVWLVAEGTLVGEQHRLLAIDHQRLRAVLGMLSPRQRQVADLMLAGCSIHRIADELCLGDSTVRNHMRRIRQLMRREEPM